MVRLKVFFFLALKRKGSSFNSNMVRLKERSTFFCRAGGGFQFQYGTIKSSVRVIFATLPIPFQFQYGTIKSRCNLTKLLLIINILKDCNWHTNILKNCRYPII